MIWIPGKVPPPSPVFTDGKKSGFAYKEEPPPPINWAEWLSLPSVQLWQALALSCGIRPSTYADALSADGIANERDFRKRMQVAEDHLKVGGQITIIEPHEKLHLTLVHLQDVANLATLCQWSVPDGFPRSEETGELNKKRMAAILAEIINRKLNPHALPYVRPGLRTVKAEISKYMAQANSPLYISPKCFDNAWQAMLNLGLIHWGNK